MTEYDGATITFNGEPIALTRRETVAPASGVVSKGYSCSFSCVIEDPDGLERIAEMFNAVRAEPVRPEGTALVPFGILGSLPVSGAVDLAASDAGVSGSMDVDERAWRRTLSVAVQNAITTGYTNWRSVAITAWQFGETPLVREMGRKIAYGRGCAYHGRRKRQKAMRRLLRAAGILGAKVGT